MSDGDQPGGVLQRAEERWGGAGRGLYGALVCAVALLAGGIVGLLLEQPWLFPSLGPTLMVLAERPLRAAAKPVNIVVGHIVGVLAGYLALLVTGLTDAPPVTDTGLDAARITAAVLSLSLTAFVLAATRKPQPPAGATTLIVSLGILTTPRDLVVIVLSVVLVAGVGTALNLLTGVHQKGIRESDG